MALPTVTTVHLPFFNRAAIIIINFIVATLLLTIFNHNKLRDRQSQIFVGMGAFILLWVDFAYLARLVGSTNVFLSEVFLRIAWVATPLLFFATYVTSLYIVGIGRRRNTHMFALGIVTLVVSILTAFTDLVITGVSFRGAALDIVYGRGFFPFLIVIFAIMVSTLQPLANKKRSKSAELFLVGVIIFYFANVIFNIALPVFFSVTHLYYFGDYSTLFLLGFTSYAIARHELLHIKVMYTEVLTVVLWVVLLLKLFVSTSLTVMLIDGFILLITVVLGILLIRSVLGEVKQKERLQVLTKRLRDLDKQKDEFISMAAHELRAPMTAIKGSLSLIMDGDTGKITKGTREYLEEATEENDRLIRLVNNMLNVSRIEEGRMVFQEGYVHLAKIARTVFNEFRAHAHSKKLTFKLIVASAIHDRVYVDGDKLHEAIENLVSNAIKYTDKGSVEIHIHNPQPDRIRLEVIDTGRGISPEEQKKLFIKFSRAESTESKTIGTGLGLYISKLLIETFGGTIGVDSEADHGSTFWFELPVKKK